MTILNGRCRIVTRDEHSLVVIDGIPTINHAIKDRMAEAYAMVTLVDQEYATQKQVASAFGVSTRTVRRQQERFAQGGLAALGRTSGYPKGRPRVSTVRSRQVDRLKTQGCSNRQIAARLGVTEKAVRKLARRLGWKQEEPEGAQEALNLQVPGADPNLSASSATPDDKGDAPPAPPADPNLSASSDEEDPEWSMDPDPADRVVDRFLAYMGMLADAAPIFRPGSRVPGAGVLLAVPWLVRSGVLQCARDVYGGIGPAFYGLRTVIVTLVLMALLRIRHPEGLKEHNAQDLGRIIGLDRAPETKTVRRKLSRLAAMGRAADFQRALVRRRVEAVGDAVGFLYVDGHVRVYHGKRPIPKAHVTRMRISMPAITDYWVNDATGDPLMVITAEANAGLVKTLPPLLRQVRALVGERPMTVIFDRGGWSPSLFLDLIGAGFDIMTYRKGPLRPVPAGQFKKHEEMIDGRTVSYCLADKGAWLMGGKLRLRQVTRRSDDGHQTAILTSRRDLSAVQVAWRMFERWRQENFFKYLKHNYALDALVDYNVEPDDPARSVPNPQWAKIDAMMRKAKTELTRIQARYGMEAVLNVEQLRRTMRGFKIANAEILQQVLAAMKRYVLLYGQRSRTPKRVPVGQVTPGQVIKLSTERKLLTNILKMVAYQAESDLVRILAPFYKRTDDEGRRLVTTALCSPADIDVADGTLLVRLAPLSSPHRSRAIAALCQELNRSPVCFPGTKLVMRFAVDGPQTP
ncbi:MAG: helix-turn-helix domain-containing protein [Gemmatimonadetes bacterium]|nr:helix-turn-helix domain-containing protein [Gemmatimonadota bacterium]